MIDKKKNNDDEDILIDDIEEVKMGKISSNIEREDIHRIYDETYKIGDDIQRHKDDKEDTMIYDEEKF